jgi:hypothetical protein
MYLLLVETMDIYFCRQSIALYTMKGQDYFLIICRSIDMNISHDLKQTRMKTIHKTSMNTTILHLQLAASDLEHYMSLAIIKMIIHILK